MFVCMFCILPILPANCVVVVVVRLECVNDPWGYAVDKLMPDRSKLRRQTKRDTGVYLFIRRVCASESETA